ncbi:hypothetical protein [Urechidicola vernalis]|uniref:DUF4136 domain-containing protein n=1 Tax=Urechidicola vernalis TaxID=3075600 RepID=A0ABU2Y3H0_9FLAO|nr:hypothetical protein [Urechidicola sp. P050]MDT0552753.1 hypothetical protein [Urechidicola sp. P050]
MKILKLSLVLLLVSSLFVGCGTSVKVADQWKNDNFAALKNEKVLVIHKTPNEVNKKRLEQDLANELRAIGVDATEAYVAFPNIKYKEKSTPEEIQASIDKITAAGYNGVILTVLKDKDQQVETTTSGGYYSGGYYPSYYGRYYGGFGSYYGGVYGYGYGGSYIPPSSTTKVVDIFLLETVSYNLGLKDGEQLVGAVSVKIKDPQSYSGVAGKYINIVMDQFAE